MENACEKLDVPQKEAPQMVGPEGFEPPTKGL